MKKWTSTYKFTVVLTTAIVGALALCAWFAYIAFKTYLETPHTYGNTEVVPYGHQMDGVLTHKWDSLQIKSNGTTVTIVNPDFDITVIEEFKGLTLTATRVSAKIVADTADKEITPKSDSPPSIPPKAKFYIPVNIGVDSVSIDAGEKHWEISQVKVQSQGMTRFGVSVDSIKGDHISHTSSFSLQGDFGGNALKLQGKVKAGKDYVDVDASLNKENLAEVKTKVDLDLKDINEWLPFEIPKSAPQIKGLSVKGEASLDSKNQKPKYKATVKTRMDDYWPLLASNVTVNLDGDDEIVHANIDLKNDEGGSIHLEGDIDKNLNIDGMGSVNDMSALFGPQMMSLDMSIHSINKNGNKMDVVAETRHGSVVECSMNFEDEFSLTYIGDMSPYEPWALDWSRGEFILRDRYKIYGSFNNGHMKALVKIDTIPYVWHVTADSLQILLDLDKNGINFSNGIIYTPKETFDVTGDVIWNGEYPHTSWRVAQRHGGVAEAYVSIIDSTTLRFKADSVEVSTLPFADFKVSENLDGKVTGFWNQNFDEHIGTMEMSIAGNVQPFNLQGQIKARENGDSVFIDKFEAIHSKNKVEAEMVFVLPNDSNPDFKPTGALPIQVVHAWASARDFSIPLLLDPLNDTTFTSGFINGDLSYTEGHGLQGNIDFTDLQFSNIPPVLFNVKKMNMFAEANKVELNAYLGIGGGGWTGNTQIILDDVFDSKRHVSISHNSDNGGDLYAEGFLDSALTFNGKLNMNGSWFVPGSVSEVKKTDLQVDVSARLKEGIRGITADIRSDSTVYQPPKINYLIPLKIRGHMENGLLNLTEVSTKNDSGETVSGTLQFDLDSLRLRAIDIQSERYTIRHGPHTLVAENISGHMEDSEEDIIITGNIPVIRYNFKDDALGLGEALAKAQLNYSIPHSQDGVLKNSTISGDLIIDKLTYYRDLEIEVTPSTMDKFLTLFNNVIAKLRSKESEVKLSTASPINLSIHVSDSQTDSVEIVTPFATFPFTFDVWVLGNTGRPLLRGDVTNSNTGFIGVQEVYEFDLNSFRISWTDVPWQHGIVDVSSSQELPYCDEAEENEKSTCPVNLDIQGTITNLQPNPSSNCGNESSAASVYYNIFLGCIANQDNETTDWNKLAGKAIGKVISSTANKTLGGEYIGDIDMKVMLFNNNTTNERDSSYFKLPISLDRWVKDLSLILGYTKDQSEDPTYDQSLQFGVNYTLPVFKDKEYSHKNHLSPSLSLYTMLVSKQYIANTGTEGNEETRVEKNVGISYVYRYWNPCLLGIGHCETIDPPDEYNDDPKPPFKKETKK
ncbi:hypothetical protein [Fibrobacter sp.]|uniref:hypothetical protein n=1 Tax=Fibrobacter sp. TaxID=35828 RepID=UPI00389112D5